MRLRIHLIGHGESLELTSLGAGRCAASASGVLLLVTNLYSFIHLHAAAVEEFAAVKPRRLTEPMTGFLDKVESTQSFNREDASQIGSSRMGWRLCVVEIETALMYFGVPRAPRKRVWLLHITSRKEQELGNLRALDRFELLARRRKS